MEYTRNLEESDEFYTNQTSDRNFDNNSTLESMFESYFNKIDISRNNIDGNLNFGNGSINVDNGSITNINNYSNLFQISELGNYWLIHDEKINKVRNIYTKFSNYETSLNVLQNKNILILYDDINKGKFTSAVYLLSELHGNNIIEYDNDIDIKSLTNTELTSDFGYIIDKYPLGLLENPSLKDTFLDALSKKFETINSHLIILLNSSSIKNDFLNEYMVKYTGIDSQLEMIKKHIYYSSKEELIAEKIICQIGNEVSNDLINKISPKECDLIVGKLLESHYNSTSITPIFTELHDSIREEIDIWFKNNTDLEQRLLMIVLSVFSGSEFRIIYTACDDFKKIILKTNKNTETSTIDHIFGKPISIRAEEVCSHVVKRLIKTEYGVNEFEFIEFKKTEFIYSVLEYIWYEYDFFQKYLIEWLFKYASHEDINVAEKASKAISQLLKYDFNYIINLIKINWIDGRKYEEKFMAARALLYYCDSEINLIRISKLLNNWTHTQNSYDVLFVSAFIYGNVGVNLPDTALENLSSIALKQPKLKNVVIISISRIFNYGYTYPENYMKVLSSLLKWSESFQEKILYTISMECFLKIVPKLNFLRNSTRPLLHLMGKDSAYINITSTMWGRLLKDPKYRDKAINELINWIESINRNSKYFYIIRDLLYTLTIESNNVWLLETLNPYKNSIKNLEEILNWLSKFTFNPLLRKESIDYKFYFIPIISYPNKDNTLVLSYSNRFIRKNINNLIMLNQNSSLSINDIIYKKYNISYLINSAFSSLEFTFHLENINYIFKLELNYQLSRADQFVEYILSLTNFSSIDINPSKIIRDFYISTVTEVLKSEKEVNIMILKDKNPLIIDMLQSKLDTIGIKITDIILI